MAGLSDLNDPQLRPQREVPARAIGSPGGLL